MIKLTYSGSVFTTPTEINQTLINAGFDWVAAAKTSNGVAKIENGEFHWLSGEWHSGDWITGHFAC